MSRVPWTCYSNFVTCPPHGDEHLLSFRRSGYHVDLRRVAGHAFLQCEQCDPPTYIFAVFYAGDDAHVTCYEISRDCYRHWSNEPGATTKSTPEMLYLLRDPEGRSLNPTWRPPKQ